MSLGPSVPNPVRARSEFFFRTEEAGLYRVVILDVSGRLVREVHRGRLDAGAHRFDWDGTDEDGKGVDSGVYFYSVAGSAGEIARRLVLIH